MTTASAVIETRILKLAIVSDPRLDGEQARRPSDPIAPPIAKASSL